MSPPTEHLPTFNREPSSTSTTGYRGACSCGWTAPVAHRGKRAEALGKAQAEALEHARTSA